jgi:hypothetical protein
MYTDTVWQDYSHNLYDYPFFLISTQVGLV